MEKCRIIFKEEVDEKLKTLVNDYWEIKNGKFVYPTLRVLSDKHCLKSFQITQLVINLADHMQWVGTCTGSRIF
jgi:hypothetical protein